MVGRGRRHDDRRGDRERGGAQPHEAQPDGDTGVRQGLGQDPDQREAQAARDQPAHEHRAGAGARGHRGCEGAGQHAGDRGGEQGQARLQRRPALHQLQPLADQQEERRPDQAEPDTTRGHADLQLRLRELDLLAHDGGEVGLRVLDEAPDGRPRWSALRGAVRWPCGRPYRHRYAGCR